MRFNKFNSDGFTLLQLMLTIAMLGLLAAFALPAMAVETYQPNYYVTDTNAATVTVTNGQGRTLTGKKVTVRQGRGISLFVKVVSTNSTATSGTVGADVTYDGTNGTTRQPLTFTFPGNFSGTNIYWTNFPHTLLNNVRTVQITTLTNNTVGTVPGSNALTTTFTWSQDNQAQ